MSKETDKPNGKKDSGVKAGKRNGKEDKEEHNPLNSIIDEPCCDHPQIKEENGYYVCLNCGMVHEELILDETPRRAFTPEEIAKRKANEPVYSPIGPRTVIQGNTDAKGSQLSAKSRAKYRKLAKIHRSLTNSYERNLWIALPNLKRLQEKLGIPQTVAEDALRIYTNAVKKKLTMGRSIDTLLAAAIFTALRIHGVPRTIEEIVKAADLPKKNIVKAYRLILAKVLPELKMRVKHFGPERYISKFTEELNLSMKVRNRAVEYIKKAIKRGMPIEGRDPKGFAAAAIYMAARETGENRTQSEIAKIANVTEVTLRMRTKDLKKYLGIR